jgi:hypothetical protein
LGRETHTENKKIDFNSSYDIGTNAEQNTLIFKVSTSFLARILKPTHHMVNLSNESDQA